MPDLGLKSFDKLYPMMIRKYQDLIVDQNASEADKINSIILKLNALGKLSNDVVRDWNTVYQWAMNDGLNQDVSNKLEAMRANGEISQLLQNIFDQLVGDMTTLHTTVKDTLVNVINEVDDLAKSNQSQLAQKATKRKIDLVADFNADSTGNTNTSTQIQNAINSIPDGESGAVILLPAGATFKLDSTINIINKHNIRFEVMGSGYMGATFLGVTSGMTLFNVQSHGVSFARTRLNGDATMTGIVVGDGVNTTFDEFRFEEDSVCVNLGIGVRSKMRNWWIRDSAFIYCNIGIQIDGYTNPDDGQDYHIIDNRFHGCQQYAVYGAGFLKDTIIARNKIDDGNHGIVLDNGADNIEIVLNEITQSFGNGIKVNQTQQGKVNVDISHNLINGNKTTDNGHGIWYNGNKATINDNKVFQKYGHGVFAESMTYGNIESNFIEGCSYSTTGYYGIYLKAGSNILVDKNTCRNAGRSMNYGIYVEDAFSYAVLGTNICEGATGDIYLSPNNTARGNINGTITSIPKIIIADAVPTSGYFRQKDEIRKSTSASGSQFGWVCTTTGTACGTAWGATTAYTVGQQVQTGGNVYQCTVAGTSGSSAPTGTGTGIVDGGVTWNYVNPRALFRAFGLVSEVKNGSSTFSGDGTTTSFTINHGMSGQPLYFNVVPTSSVAGTAGIKYVTSSLTQLTITFNTAPASGTNNITLTWKAEVY